MTDTLNAPALPKLPRPAVHAWADISEHFLRVDHFTADQMREYGETCALAARSTTPSPAAPAGWKLVPIEPTREMIEAGHQHTLRADEGDDKDEIYRARGQAIAAYSDRVAPSAAPASGDALVAGAVPAADADVPTGNVWHNLRDVAPTLQAAARGEWGWGANTRCKYIELRIDMRDGGCLIYDRHRVRITPKTLAHQVGNMGGLPWAEFASLLAAPSAGEPQADAAEPVAEIILNRFGGRETQWRDAQTAAEMPAGTLLYTHAQPAPQALGAAEGWKLVPVTPTEEMQSAGRYAGDPNAWVAARSIYAAMLAAAPTTGGQSS